MYWASGNGVSPSMAGLGAALYGALRQGEARLGLAWVAMAARRAYGPSLPPSLADAARQGMARPGVDRPGLARRGRAWAADGGTEGFGSPCHPHKGGYGLARTAAAGRGAARQGWARQGMGCRPQHWGLRLPLLLSTEGRRGMPRQCRDGQGSARRGGAWLGKGCRQQHGASSEAPCCSLWRADGAVPGTARRGSAWLGGARFGTVRQGLTISARRAQVLPAGFTQHTSRHD